MIEIKTMADLNQLKTRISAPFYDVVEEFVLQLLESLTSLDMSPDQYCLENDGYVVVFEQNDTGEKVPGLINGLINSFPGPEWIEFLPLSCGNVYQLAYMLDNDFIMIYYLEQTSLIAQSPDFIDLVNSYLSSDDIDVPSELPGSY